MSMANRGLPATRITDPDAGPDALLNDATEWLRYAHTSMCAPRVLPGGEKSSKHVARLTGPLSDGHVRTQSSSYLPPPSARLFHFIMIWANSRRVGTHVMFLFVDACQ